MAERVQYKDLGEIGYQEAWDYQTNIFDAIINEKIALRKEQNQSKAKYHPNKKNSHQLLFCSHPNVYTLGKSGQQSHLLANTKLLQSINATFVKTNRGGDITYHGPGQIVGYPILDLDHFFTDLGKYMRCLEEVIIITLKHYNLIGERLSGATGVWLEAQTSMARKICAMGVKTSHWVTMHGFALNVNTDLSYYNHIVPCGIADKAVTSIQKELSKEIDVEEVKQLLIKNFEVVFNAQCYE